VCRKTQVGAPTPTSYPTAVGVPIQLQLVFLLFFLHVQKPIGPVQENTQAEAPTPTPALPSLCVLSWCAGKHTSKSSYPCLQIEVGKENGVGKEQRLQLFFFA